MHSSPEKLTYSPVAITARVIRHNSDQSSPPVAAASSDKEELNTEEEEEGEEEDGSWASLPQQRQESGSLDDDHQQEIPKAVGSRVEQLTKMVENLTAKFVLLENHLKLATEVQGERHGSTDGAGTGGAVEGEKEREEGERKLPLRDITREMMLKQAHGSSPVNQPKSTGSPTKHSTKKVNNEAAISQREATPLSSVVSTPDPSSKRTPLSSVGEDYIHQRYTSHTTHHSLKLDFATPSTPVGIQKCTHHKVITVKVHFSAREKIM